MNFYYKAGFGKSQEFYGNAFDKGARPLARLRRWRHSVENFGEARGAEIVFAL